MPHFPFGPIILLLCKKFTGYMFAYLLIQGEPKIYALNGDWPDVPFFDQSLLDSVRMECVMLSTRSLMDTDPGIVWEECIHIYIYIYSM